MAFTINPEKCIGCGACAWVCLFSVPEMTDEEEPRFVIPKEKCIGCGHCENICPNNAISPLPDHKRLKKVSIDQEKCIGCTVCQHVCPDKAPFGERGNQCGMCAAKCRHDAILKEYDG